MAYWLMKSEPSTFSIDDLASRPGQTEPWDGVRNYQARNMIRDDMKIGDGVLFYHSNCELPGIVGLAEITSKGYPDHTAFIIDHPHYDPKSKPEKPSWFMVDVRFVRKLARAITLSELKVCSVLENMALVRKGNRLSVMPVSEREWNFILTLE